MDNSALSLFAGLVQGLYSGILTKMRLDLQRQRFGVPDEKAKRIIASAKDIAKTRMLGAAPELGEKVADELHKMADEGRLRSQSDVFKAINETVNAQFPKAVQAATEDIAAPALQYGANIVGEVTGDDVLRDSVLSAYKKAAYEAYRRKYKDEADKFFVEVPPASVWDVLKSPSKNPFLKAEGKALAAPAKELQKLWKALKNGVKTDADKRTVEAMRKKYPKAFSAMIRKLAPTQPWKRIQQ